MKARFLTPAVCSALLVGTLAGACRWSLSAVLQLQEAAGAVRLATGMRALLERAHRVHDDLAVQNTVQALSQVQGVTGAYVTDPDGRILAHPEATLIGRSVHGARHPRPTGAFGLREGSVVWGTLWISFMDRSLREKVAQQQNLAAVILAMAWLGFLIYVYRSQQGRGKLEQQVTDSAILQEEETRKWGRAQKQHQQRQDLFRRQMELLIDQFPQPALLLDAHQRVIATNRLMQTALQVKTSADWLGRSWQELPFLQACGSALEKSLHSPDQVFEVTEASLQGRLVLRSPAEAGGEAIGTWVTLLDS